MRRALLLLPLLLAACEPPQPRLAGSGMDMFAPTAIRLHPFTRFVTPNLPPATTAPTPATQASNLKSQVSLEAHLEFSDQFSDPTKGAGTLTVQLYDQPGILHKGALIESWTLPLSSPEQHRDHWDRTTRTYVFMLPLANTLPANRDHLLVTATLTLPNGELLSDELQRPTK